jgi:hypothetical protein
MVTRRASKCRFKTCASMSSYPATWDRQEIRCAGILGAPYNNATCRIDLHL